MILLLCAILLIAGPLSFSETADLPELKSNHRDIHDPEYYDAEKKKGRKNVGQVGKDLEKFGVEVADRIDKIVSRKGFALWDDPWTIQGIPLLFPSSDSGFNLGVHAILANIRREDPHQTEFSGQILASDRGRYKHFFKVDLPHFLDDHYHFTAKFAYNRDVTFRYYGVGNEAPVDMALVRANDSIFQNTRTGPSFTVSFLKKIGKYVRLGPILNLKWTEIGFPPGSLLDTEQPIGVAGGRTHSIGGAIVYDALDFAPNPRKGTYHELYLAYSAPFVGSEYHFLRSTYTFTHYIQLRPSLVLAHRTLLESLSGTVPFYELGATGGSNSSIGFGGDRFLRGYDGNRFIDHIKTVMSFELRWEAMMFSWAKQKFEVSIVPFIDVGRVWDKIFPYQGSAVHASTGWGTRFVWNDRFVIRTDLALNPEGSSLYVELGQSF